MSHTERARVIGEWCNERCNEADERNAVACDTCVIEDLCAECLGNFVDHPAITAAAYDIITERLATEEEMIPDMVNHPPHYTQGGMECIDEMIMIFGKQAVRSFCLCNAWKYRKRALYKNGQEDMDKSNWYLNKYKELVEYEH